MAGKGKHAKAKRLTSKKSRAMQRSVTGPSPVATPAAPVEIKATPRPANIPAAAKPPGVSARPAPARYGYVLDELKKIGIFAGIIIVILVILAIFVK
ncbi:MAG: hypothetical protein ABID87_06805 [Chloroflexota bacterium]